MGYLSVQRWVASHYKVGDGEFEDAVEESSGHREIIRAHQMEVLTSTAAEYRKQFAHIPTSQEECDLLKRKQRKTDKDKILINLFQIKKVLPRLDLEELDDSKLLNLTKHWAVFLFAHEFRNSEMEDPIGFCTEEFHKVGHPNANNMHLQFRR